MGGITAMTSLNFFFILLLLLLLATKKLIKIIIINNIGLDSGANGCLPYQKIRPSR